MADKKTPETPTPEKPRYTVNWNLSADGVEYKAGDVFSETPDEALLASGVLSEIVAE